MIGEMTALFWARSKEFGFRSVVSPGRYCYPGAFEILRISSCNDTSDSFNALML